MAIHSRQSLWEADSEGIELLDQTIGDLLDDRAAVFPDRVALVYNYPELGLDLRLTYRQYKEEAERLAKGLLALGIEKGEHVAVWATNLPEWIFLELALAKIGAVLVTVNTNYRAAELRYLLHQGDVATLFMMTAHRDNSFLDSINSIVPELRSESRRLQAPLKCAALPRLRRVVLIDDIEIPGFVRYREVLEMGHAVSDETLRQRQSGVRVDDVAQIQYTSGTTGFPKGALLTHHGLVNNSLLYVNRVQMTADDRSVSPMPLFHTAGCVIGVLGPILSGATLIPMIVFDAGKALELIAEEKATCFSAVPTMLISMLNHSRFRSREFDTSSLRWICTGGAPVPIVLMEQINAEMGANPVIVFGQTEASPVITQTLLEDSFEFKSATVGKPLPHVAVKIVQTSGTEAGRPVALGESGELLARGFLVMKGYYNMPERTAETIDADGWLHTGDLATMDDAGYVRIVGRVKDMVIRGGENLFPAEIEAFLMRHPKIEEAQVIGVPDAFMGEELCALLRLKSSECLGEDEVREYCRSGISRHKIPKHFRFVTAFPLTASGKVKKFELREWIIQDLKLTGADVVQ